MRLAETIVVRLGGRVLEMRPTLRAALVLERRHGLDRLGGKLLDLNLTAVADTIAATAFGPYDAEEILALLLAEGVERNAGLVPDLLPLIDGLLGADSDAEETETEEPAKGEPATVAEILADLFAIATGKIGWTPNEAFQATPLEILTAWKARCELLKQIFGGAPEKKPASVDDKLLALVQRNEALASVWEE